MREHVLLRGKQDLNAGVDSWLHIPVRQTPEEMEGNRPAGGTQRRSDVFSSYRRPCGSTFRRFIFRIYFPTVRRFQSVGRSDVSAPRGPRSGVLTVRRFRGRAAVPTFPERGQTSGRRPPVRKRQPAGPIGRFGPTVRRIRNVGPLARFPKTLERLNRKGTP